MHYFLNKNHIVFLNINKKLTIFQRRIELGVQSYTNSCKDTHATGIPFFVILFLNK